MGASNLWPSQPPAPSAWSSPKPASQRRSRPRGQFAPRRAEQPCRPRASRSHSADGTMHEGLKQTDDAAGADAAGAGSAEAGTLASAAAESALVASARRADLSNVCQSAPYCCRHHVRRSAFETAADIGWNGCARRMAIKAVKGRVRTSARWVFSLQTAELTARCPHQSGLQSSCANASPPQV